MSIFFSILLIIIGYFSMDYIGFIGMVLLITDIYFKYFKSFVFTAIGISSVVVCESIAGYLWHQSIVTIVGFGILAFITLYWLPKWANRFKKEKTEE